MGLLALYRFLCCRVYIPLDYYCKYPRDWDCVMYYHPIIFIQYAAGDTANESIREGLFSNLKGPGVTDSNNAVVQFTAITLSL